MAKTNSDKIDEFGRALEALLAKMNRVEADLARIVAKLEENARANEELRTRVALLEREVADLKARRDEWGRRLWQLLVPVVSAVAGGVVGYYLKR